MLPDKSTYLKCIFKCRKQRNVFFVQQKTSPVYRYFKPLQIIVLYRLLSRSLPLIFYCIFRTFMHLQGKLNNFLKGNTHKIMQNIFKSAYKNYIYKTHIYTSKLGIWEFTITNSLYTPVFCSSKHVFHISLPRFLIRCGCDNISTEVPGPDLNDYEV